jgi:hypothetical protein
MGVKAGSEGSFLAWETESIFETTNDDIQVSFITDLRMLT